MHPAAAARENIKLHHSNHEKALHQRHAQLALKTHIACHCAGDVPNLFGADDMEAISAGVRPAMAAAGLPINKMTIYSYFINRCEAMQCSACIQFGVHVADSSGGC
jgi:hypothetical protein